VFLFLDATRQSLALNSLLEHRASGIRGPRHASAYNRIYLQMAEVKQVRRLNCLVNGMSQFIETCPPALKILPIRPLSMVWYLEVCRNVLYSVAGAKIIP